MDDRGKILLGLKMACLLSGTVALFGSQVSCGSVGVALADPVVANCTFSGGACSKLRVALLFAVFAFLNSIAILAGEFMAIRRSFLAVLSIPGASFFLIVFALCADVYGDKIDGSSCTFGAGFAFAVIGFVASVGHFIVSNQADPALPSPVSMDATKATLILGALSLLSIIIGLATPLVTTGSYTFYLTKLCLQSSTGGQCTDWHEVSVQTTTTMCMQGALASACLALILSVAVVIMHLTAISRPKPQNLELLGGLSIAVALCSLTSFALVTTSMDVAGFAGSAHGPQTPQTPQTPASTTFTFQVRDYRNVGCTGTPSVSLPTSVATSGVCMLSGTENVMLIGTCAAPSLAVFTASDCSGTANNAFALQDLRTIAGGGGGCMAKTTDDGVLITYQEITTDCSALPPALLGQSHYHGGFFFLIFGFLAAIAHSVVSEVATTRRVTQTDQTTATTGDKQKYCGPMSCYVAMVCTPVVGTVVGAAVLAAKTHGDASATAIGAVVGAAVGAMLGAWVMLCPVDKRVVNSITEATTLERAGPFIVLGTGYLHGEVFRALYAGHGNGVLGTTMNACWVAWVTAWSFAGIVALAIVARCVAQLEGGTRGRLTSQFHDMMNGICSSPLVVGVLVFASMVSAIVVACSSVGDRTFRPLEMLSFTVLAPFLLKFMGVDTDCDRLYVGTCNLSPHDLPDAHRVLRDDDAGAGRRTSQIEMNAMGKDAGRRVSQVQMDALPAAPVVAFSPGGAEIKICETAVEAAMSGIVAPHLPPPTTAAVLCSGCGTVRVAGVPFCSNCGTNYRNCKN
jgi:hypothetical protein